MNRITAQVACEAIVNHPDEGWEIETIDVVLTDAREAGVPALYVDMLADIYAARLGWGGVPA